MNKKIILLFTSVIILTLLLVIVKIGVLRNSGEERLPMRQFLLYSYDGNRPSDINHQTVRYLLENRSEKRKNLPNQDVSSFKHFESEHILFYDQHSNKHTKFKKGAIKTLFIFRKPYFAISDGVRITVEAINQEGQFTTLVKDLKQEKNKTFSDGKFAFIQGQAGVSGLNSKGENAYYEYFQIKQVANLKPTSFEKYAITIYDLYTETTKSILLKTQGEIEND